MDARREEGTERQCIECNGEREGERERDRERGREREGGGGKTFIQGCPITVARRLSNHLTLPSAFAAAAAPSKSSSAIPLARSSSYALPGQDPCWCGFVTRPCWLARMCDCKKAGQAERERNRSVEVGQREEKATLCRGSRASVRLGTLPLIHNARESESEQKGRRR
jgi:hypothetical protein